MNGIRGREKGSPLGNFGMGCRFIRTEMLFAVETCINKKQTEVKATDGEIRNELRGGMADEK